MENTGCLECNFRLAAASDATRRHIQAISRQQTAALRHEHELAKALATAAEYARQFREKAIAAYKKHIASHQLNDAEKCA